MLQSSSDQKPFIPLILSFRCKTPLWIERCFGRTGGAGGGGVAPRGTGTRVPSPPRHGYSYVSKPTNDFHQRPDSGSSQGILPLTSSLTESSKWACYFIPSSTFFEYAGVKIHRFGSVGTAFTYRLPRRREGERVEPPEPTPKWRRTISTCKL